ncbi:MAG TPA: DUF2378 family protein [Myxococcaceae bacterium]|nr:DUF2378 family protein [Myxococcaceae bacterium]
MSDVPSVSTVDSTLFEAMFVRTLTPTGAFAEELRQTGFDLAQMQPKYPAPIWRRCVEVARRHTYPELPKEEGMRQLGRDFMKGYYGTLLGKVVSAAMPLIGLERTLNRLERMWKGSSSVVKVGTKVKSIRLVEGDHDIDCRIEGIGPWG